MEDAISYIIVFGLIIGGVAFWQFRISKARPYMLSRQFFPELNLYLLIEKQEGKTKEFIIKIDFKKKTQLIPTVVELIDKNRNHEIIGLDTLKNSNTDKPENKSSINSKYSFSEFSQLLKNCGFKFKTFRIVIENENGKKFKSHELAFNKRWTIYLPDSGKYN